jgi:N-acetylglucosamine kinase-like BadF-type ATPase
VALENIDSKKTGRVAREQADFKKEMSQYFLGVDGGQSSTTAMIGDETGRVVGVGRGGPCNHVRASEGRARFVDAVQSSLRAACAQAGLQPGVTAASVRFTSACLGFSGGPADRESILREIFLSDRTVVTDDSFVALTGATGGEPGIVVIAGTGSIAFGRNARGRTARVGGWGYLFGDEGGAFWIARQAMRAALGWEEGWGVPTSLRARLLDHTRTRNINDLLHRCYTPEFPRSRVASLSILVNHAAESGDPLALEILDAAGRELGALVEAVLGQVFEAGEPAIVSYSGGVFGSRIVLGRFRDWTASQAGVRVSPPAYPVHGGAVGALLEAYRAAGLNKSYRLSGISRR